MACGVLSVVMVLLWIIFSRDSINCPEYENWKRAFLGGGYVPYESSKLVLILVLSAILSSSLKKVLFHKYEIPIFRKGLSSHPWRCIHWPEGWCSVGSPECQAEKQNLPGQFFWTMLHVLKLWSLTMNQNVKLNSAACRAVRLPLLNMFWNTRAKAR